ncbi:MULTISPECIES: 6-phosphogluconolactonase [Rhodococcus]|uniref:6-phosphogluconolactonase n=1 Tax=Rhodococcus TaxID=1827 RepID=UPI00192B8979|nr:MULTISPECIES: 6-phosphogluconolactonase [Rhodococcus]MDJ0417707.1 6-phosphogluconolactonase [Rhodococcus opacus]QQZ14578.1 6-phosphogluconolactonase [Rhodococcus sp. 21391]UOT03674.1 6-phosphogluconolactonase [Rhodococcus opacus]
MTTTRTTSAPSKPIPYIYDDSEQLAGDVASRLLSNLAQAQKERAYASLVLTGGRTGTAVLERLRTAPNRDIVNWHRVNFFWGDERFVARHHPDRNEKQAREALLDHLPVDPSRVHVMAPCDGGFGNDATAVANAYQALLCAYGRLDRTPLFDICLLGMGEEGHVASIFPDSPAVLEKQREVVAVYNCPKPPSTRISLTLSAITRSREVWLMTTGDAKASAVATLMEEGVTPQLLPAAGALGSHATRVFLDAAAASLLSNCADLRASAR